MIQNVHIVKNNKDKQFVLVSLQLFLVDKYKIEKDLYVTIIVDLSFQSIVLCDCLNNILEFLPTILY